MLALTRRVVLVAVVAATAGCAFAEPSRSPIPTRRPLPPGVVALDDYRPCEAVAQPGVGCVYAGHAVVGVLHERHGCVWMVMDNGVDVRILWPWGYSASFDPFVVYDNRGEVVARNGDHVYTGGWGPEQGEPDACGRAKYVSVTDEFQVGSEIGS